MPVYFSNRCQKIPIAGIVTDTPTGPKTRPNPFNVMSGEAKDLCGGNCLSLGRVDGEVAKAEGAVGAEETQRRVVLHPAKTKDILLPVVKGNGHYPPLYVLCSFHLHPPAEFFRQ
jgi:hypothetical protein